MKYMTFNSACSYAGVANMLARFGVDTEDRTIALDMKLPYLFAHEDGAYMAGPMLQSAQWFNLYLHPIGFELIERDVPSAQVAAYLRRQETAMLGLRVDDTGKHAVVYIGNQGDTLTFLNNKWEHTDVPEQLMLSEEQLLSRLSDTAMIATLNRVAPQAVDLRSRMENSIAVIRRNLVEIHAACRCEMTAGQLRQRLNTLFRPLLLDGITMLQLIDETALADQLSSLQRGLLAALKQPPDKALILGEYLSMDELAGAAERYIRLIQDELSNGSSSRTLP